ncbi:MAG: hypothetical protein K9L74_06920, partial [Candidatus Izimaplasma sp.]|nr:hypothetical protein [Candidatus Izimaplasma bacterium]
MKEKINKFIIVFSEKVLPVLTIIFWPIIKLFEALTKLPAIVKAVLSGIIWGFGQLLNRQYVKALIFFLLFALILGVEFGTGNYGHEFDLYDDKMPGDEIQEELSNYYPTWYYYNHVDFNPTSSYAYEDYSLLHDVAESNNLTFDEETFLFYDASNNIVEVDNISYTNKDMYEFLGLELRRIEEIEFDNGVEDIKEEADQLATIKVETLVESTLDEMADRDVRLSNTFIIDRQERMEEIATEELI